MIIVNEALNEIADGRDFDSLKDALMDLSPEQATAIPHGAPRSIANTVFHMWFWQDRWLNQIAEKELEPFPGDGSDFREVPANDWVALRDQFMVDFGEMVQRSSHVAVFDKPTQFGDTVQVILLRSALHASYHIGQVVMIRQML
jgi:uncharacterized damage-inducible protein DinB